MLEGMTALVPDAQDLRPTSDLRARKRAATHAGLATAAFALATEHGLDGFTVDDVARRADVSRRTFFNHFASKEEAVTAVVRLTIASLLDDVERRITAKHDAPDRDAAHDREAGAVIMADAVRSLLSDESVATFRALIRLAEASPELVPHLAGIEHEAGDQVVELMRGQAGEDQIPPTHAVYAFAIPGAVIATVGAVYSRRLHVREVDGDAPGALALDDMIAQLQSLVPAFDDCAGMT